MINVGKLREANRTLNDPVVSKYLEKIRGGQDARQVVEQMLGVMPRNQVAKLVLALIGS